jgi:acyl-CoA synthetase (AMP-forming)/AMP-acid ligase II
MSEGDWALAAVHDVVTAAVPDRAMLVCGPVRRTFAEVRERIRSLAAFLGTRGIGLRREREELARWESGQDTVGLVLHNCAEYVEAMLGAYRARAVPFNVNQHYRPAEVGALLVILDTRAVVYHRRFGPLVAAAADARDLVVVDVDDGSGDEDGYLWCRGRLDDMFKVKGASVYPSEVEAALRSLDAVRQAHVTDVPDGGGRSEVGALVVTDEACDAVAAALRPRLSAFKLPTRWLVTSDAAAVPTTATGKVDKEALRALLRSEEGA